jgi:hypothetical protein
MLGRVHSFGLVALRALVLCLQHHNEEHRPRENCQDVYPCKRRSITRTQLRKLELKVTSIKYDPDRHHSQTWPGRAMYSPWASMCVVQFSLKSRFHRRPERPSRQEEAGRAGIILILLFHH